MSLKAVAEADIAAVIQMDPVVVTRANGSQFDAARGPRTNQREFTEGGIEYTIDGSLLCLSSDVTTINSKSSITVDSRTVRILTTEPDQLNAGTVLTYGSLSKQ